MTAQSDGHCYYDSTEKKEKRKRKIPNQLVYLLAISNLSLFIYMPRIFLCQEKSTRFPRASDGVTYSFLLRTSEN